MARILITCFGSYGDLYPYIALGKALQSRNHEIVLGTTILYQQKVEAEGLSFCHIRCGFDQYITPEITRQFLQRVFNPIKGSRFLVREQIRYIEESYQDTYTAARDVDLVISNPLAYATPLVCKTLNKRWLSTALSPMVFMSANDPPILSSAAWLKQLHGYSKTLYRGLLWILKIVTKSWTKPLYEFCITHKLAVPDDNPLFDGQFSPYGTLAMFPACIAQPQRDWPAHTTVTGFPLFSAEEADSETLARLEKFLQSGEPPLVFALGSLAVNIATGFFETSSVIARQLGQRAILVVGAQDDNLKQIEPGDDLLIIHYVAYDKLFPHARVIIHQGGIGTLAEAIAAQRPMLIVPFGFDQFDNAERAERLGIAKTLSRTAYNLANAAPLIDMLATEPHYQQRAAEIGASIRNDHAIEHACAVIEAVLPRSGNSQL